MRHSGVPSGAGFFPAQRVSTKESGFALLLVFVLAAAIAISLYMELPRVAFESQRAREQMSIDRGMQYAHAIQLFQRKYGAFPQNLDDLETKRNIRFLRHRYLDPLTGKEYRLIHVGPAGQLTDSLVQPAPNPNQPAQNSGSTQPGGAQPAGSSSSGAQPGGSPSAASQPATDQNGQPISPGLNMALRRPSDRIVTGTEQPVPADPEPTEQPQNPQYPGQPGQVPSTGQPIYTGVPTYPGQVPQTGQPQDPSQTGQPVYPGQQPGQQLQPGQQFQYPAQLPGQPVVAPYPGQTAQPQDPSAAGQTQQLLPGQQPLYPTQLQQFAGQPDSSGQAAQYPVQQSPYPVQPGQVQYPGQPVPVQPGQVIYPGQQPQYPAQPGYPVTNPGQQPNPSQPYNPFAPNPTASQPAQPYNPFQQNSGQPGASQPVTPPAGTGNAGQAAGLIQQILTTPRQPPSSVAGITGGSAGIAGVASTAEGKGIHVVRDRSKYKEWEFIYNMRANSMGQVVVPQLPGQQQNQNQTPTQTPASTGR